MHLTNKHWPLLYFHLFKNYNLCSGSIVSSPPLFPHIIIIQFRGWYQKQLVSLRFQTKHYLSTIPILSRIPAGLWLWIICIFLNWSFQHILHVSQWRSWKGTLDRCGMYFVNWKWTKVHHSNTSIVKMLKLLRDL